jgi:hypothetical protein
MLYFFRNFCTLTQYKLNVILIQRWLRIRGISFHVDSELEEFLTNFSYAKSRLRSSQQTRYIFKSTHSQSGISSPGAETTRNHLSMQSQR